MKSSLKNMVLVLFCITFISAACVGVVNMITEGPIAAAKEAAVKAALAQVLPEFDATEKSEHTADELLIIAHKATKGGEVVGYAIESQTKNGFSGLVPLRRLLYFMIKKEDYLKHVVLKPVKLLKKQPVHLHQVVQKKQVKRNMVTQQNTVATTWVKITAITVEFIVYKRSLEI